MQQKFTNPLDNIRVAKPCPADWNGMFGNDRKRFCGECKLNVYNLSDMTRTEAENFLLESEGRLCVRFFRRDDGTILTKDCPVGLAALKKRVSRAMTAVFSIIAGLFTGLFAFHIFKPESRTAVMGDVAIETPVPPRYVPPPITEVRGKPYLEVKGEVDPVPMAGGITNLDSVKQEIRTKTPRVNRVVVVGQENKK